MADTEAENGVVVAGHGHPCLAIVQPDQEQAPRRCGKVDSQKGASIFRGEDWCCENHHKLVVAQREQETSLNGPGVLPKRLGREGQ